MSDSTDTTEHSAVPTDGHTTPDTTAAAGSVTAEPDTAEPGTADSVAADSVAQTERPSRSGEGTESADQRPSRTQLLEEEGDIAADYLEELLDIADLDGDIDIDVADGRAQLAVLNEEGGDGLRMLVGRDGQVLSALQELTRLTVQAQTGQRSWLMLDIDGYRNQRKDELRRVAQEAVESVQVDGESVSLRPMNSFERKVVHDVVAKAGLRSESEGEGDRRHVIVHSA